MKVKDRLLEFLAVHQAPQPNQRPDPLPRRPAGVGKTSLGRCVADALGRKFARISLGGMRDEAEIRGHRRTYVGAHARPHHPDAAPGREPEPGDPARRAGQGRRGFSRRPGGGAARGAGPGAEQHLHATITWTSPSTFPGSCSSPPQTGWSRFTPRCATGWKSSNCPVTPSPRSCRLPSATWCRASWKSTGLTRRK